MWRQIWSLVQDLFGLLYPRLCAACNEALKKQEDEICLKCEFDLPYTDFHLHQEHSLAKQFWGRVKLRQAMALLYYSKGNRTQQILHQFKYKNQPEIGLMLGKKIGERLKSSGSNIQLIIPVPLHPSRQRKRGYNQSEYLAKGIAAVLQVPVHSNILLRKTATSTQTKKDRFARVENMKEIFTIKNSALLVSQHVLLVDDVITSGATIEACALSLESAAPASISVAAAAYTK